jgi:hypothetical protein
MAFPRKAQVELSQEANRAIWKISEAPHRESLQNLC